MNTKQLLDLNLLQDLTNICSTPGNELGMREYLIKALSKEGKIIKTRWTGFYLDYKKNSPKKKTNIVITAHMDSPGFTVRNINEDGTLDIIPLGGINPDISSVRSVNLQTSKKSYNGILTISGEKDENDNKDTNYQGYFGFSSQKDAKTAGVEKGDPVCFTAPIYQLRNNYIAAPYLDNRIGIYILLKTLQTIKNIDLKCNIYFAFTSCEEIGGRCARIMADMIKPSIAICLDATYEEGSIEMGKGPVITLSDASVILPRVVRDSISKIAQKSKIPLQFEVYNSAGTDAASFKDTDGGCLTIPILVASLNNHSSHEICSMKDVNNSTKLILAFLKNHNLLNIS